jgi:hypothetical protein
LKTRGFLQNVQPDEIEARTVAYVRADTAHRARVSMHHDRDRDVIDREGHLNVMDDYLDHARALERTLLQLTENCSPKVTMSGREPLSKDPPRLKPLGTPTSMRSFEV